MILKMKFDSLYVVACRKTTEQHNKKPLKGRLLVTSSEATTATATKFMIHKFIHFAMLFTASTATFM